MRIKNWEKFQHYKNRKPLWIKLYDNLVDDPDWHNLDPLAAKVLIGLWICAARNGNSGSLPEMKKIAFLLRIDVKKLASVVGKLQHWIELDSNTIASCYQSATPEESRVEESRVEKSRGEESRGEESSAAHSPKPARLSDDDFIKKLKENPAYKGINIDQELGKMDAWLSTKPGRKKTRQFVVNWLNKIDKPMTAAPKRTADPDKNCPKCHGVGFFYDEKGTFRGRCSCRDSGTWKIP